jgi:hypothetical protein
LWRNEADITSTWGSILGIINTYVRKQNEMIGWSGPGRFHDPDMVSFCAKEQNFGTGNH